EEEVAQTVGGHAAGRAFAHGNRLDGVRVVAEQQVGAGGNQTVRYTQLRRIRSGFVFVAPVEGDDDGVGPGAGRLDGGEGKGFVPEGGRPGVGGSASRMLAIRVGDGGEGEEGE